jgi:hypothetical protein
VIRHWITLLLSAALVTAAGAPGCKKPTDEETKSSDDEDDDDKKKKKKKKKKGDDDDDKAEASGSSSATKPDVPVDANPKKAKARAMLAHIAALKAKAQGAPVTATDQALKAPLKYGTFEVIGLDLMDDPTKRSSSSCRAASCRCASTA